jgi:glucan-binding YG repeat protein/GH25 family lysozyme M1 (1,4-beta-N-acetylmuramidase)
MRTTRSKIAIIIILAAAIVCLLGLRIYNGHLFFFDMPDRSGWVGEGDGRRYLDRHAGVVTDTLLKIDNKTYYFGSDGAVAKGEIELDGFTYYFSETTGVMQTGWVERDGRRYYYEENGHKVMGREFTIGGADFLFDEGGAEFIGQIEIEGKLYYFEELTGKLKDSEKQVDGNWFYFTGDGSRFGTGWVTLVDGRICYYDGDAGMLTGEQTIDGQKYLLSISLGGRLTGTAYYSGMVYDIDEKGVVLGKNRIPVWSGVDVSWHQGPDIDWAKVKESGVQFVIVRAGYIGSEERPYWVQDEYFVQNVLGAQAQGISVGAYIYLYNFTEEGLAEGIDSFAAATLDSRVRLDLPVFLDVEDADYFKAGSDGLGGYEYRTNLVRFGMERLREKGYDPGFYTFQRWVGTEFDVERLYSEGYPFWLARWYDNNEELPPETLSWDNDKQPSLWQYRATGEVDGIRKEVDKNYLYWNR